MNLDLLLLSSMLLNFIFYLFQLVELIRDRLTTSYYGLRQSFRSNDPLGQGNAPRSAMGRILFHVVGFTTPDEVSKLLERYVKNN